MFHVVHIASCIAHAHKVQRVRKNALHLARVLSASDSTRKPDLLTIELAALLHDVLDKKYVSAEEAADPYAFFLPFFERAAKEHGVKALVSLGGWTGGSTLPVVIIWRTLSSSANRILLYSRWLAGEPDRIC